MGPWDIITFVDFQDFPAPQFPSLVRDPCLTISTSPRFAAKCLGGPKRTYPINTSTSNNYCNKEMKKKRIRFYKHKLLVIFFGKSKLNQKDILKNYLQKYIQLTVLT